jgi:hypothetical protein
LLDVTNVLISDQKSVANDELESFVGSQSFLSTLSPVFHTLDLANAAAAGLGLARWRQCRRKQHP